MLASNSVVIMSFRTTLWGCPFVEASKIMCGFFPGLICIPWAVWQHHGAKWSTQSLTGSTWLCFSSLVIVLVAISRFILNVAWLPFWIMEAFISDVSSKLSLKGQPWVRIRLMWVASVSLTWDEISSRIWGTFLLSPMYSPWCTRLSFRGARSKMDSTGGCHFHSGRLDLSLFHVAKSWFSQWTEIQHFWFGGIANHFSVQRIDFGEVHNIFIHQKWLGRLEELNNYVIKLQILDPILMIWAWFHRATAKESQDGRVGCRCSSWLTFLNMVTFYLIPCFWHETLNLEIMVFFLIWSDNLGPVEFKHAAFKVLTWFASGAVLDVSFNLLSIILSRIN